MTSIVPRQWGEGLVFQRKNDVMVTLTVGMDGMKKVADLLMVSLVPSHSSGVPTDSGASNLS